MNIVHLHTHSDYSLLDGLAKIKQLVNKAKDNGMPALALTDHGVMYGAVKFYKACEEAGIKPIVGCEVYVARRKRTDKDGKQDSKPFHLTLLAKNKTGYKNLLKIVSESHLVGFYYKPRTDKEFLAKHGEGIICLSGCPAAEIPRAVQEGDFDKARALVKEYMSFFGEENFFFEIQPHKLKITKETNAGIIKLAKEFNRPLVATNDIHYLNHDDQQAHEVLLAVNTGKDLDDSERMSLEEASLHMMTADEMLAALPEYKDAIDQSVKIAEMVDLQLDFGQSILPEFPLPKGETAISFLGKKAAEGFENRYGKKPDLESTEDPNKDHSARLKYELEVIEKTGFASYFLIVSDFVSWAKEQGIFVGPGRGSAAGSIVAYCMNITDLDPLAYNLLFERFLNPERIAMPDIDLDFADDRRGEVIEHIKRTYGDDHVAQITTFGIMKARLAVRDVARSMGYPYDVGDRIAKSIPMGMTLEESLKTVKELKQMYDEDSQIKEVVDMSYKLEGVARHASTHAAGVVISKDPLVEYVPLQRSTTTDGASTQYDMVDIEAIGLLKVDILGLANLTIMKNALRIIRKVEGVEFDIKKIPLDDKKTFELLARGDTIGVFQLESEGMRHYIKELQPTNLEDIMAMVSLYRPGPMEFIPDYISGKRGKRKVTYLHPKLEPILGDTFGIAVYQEQILQMARSIAGFSYGEADVLRKAIGKKKKDLLAQQREKFIEGAVKQGTEKETAAKLFDFAEPFARYGFNRAHAACYAFIAYQTAYLKANYPEAFMAALLTSEQKDLDKIAVAITESNKLGIEIKPPHINESFMEFGVVKDDQAKKYIRFGLAAVKNVGEKASELIVDERTKNGPFKSFEDFLIRLGGQAVNKKVIESLAKAGALEGFAKRNQVLASIDDIVKFAQNANKQKQAGQVDLFGGKIEVDFGKLKLTDVPEASKKQQLAWEKEYLGLFISDHPLKEYSEQLSKIATPINTLTDSMIDKTVRVAGLITTSRKIITKSNQPMAFVSIEDLGGTIEIVVFPGVLEANPHIWEEKGPIVVDGRINTKDGSLKLLASNAYVIDADIPPLREFKGRSRGPYNGSKPFNKPDSNASISMTAPAPTKSFSKTQKKVTITLPRGAKKELLVSIKEVISQYPGDIPVSLLVPNNGDYHLVATKSTVTPGQQLIEAVESVTGQKSVSVS